MKKGLINYPTKTEIIENSWVEFLEYCKEHNDKNPHSNPIDQAGYREYPKEETFWFWYIEYKMEPTK